MSRSRTAHPSILTITGRTGSKLRAALTGLRVSDVLAARAVQRGLTPPPPIRFKNPNRRITVSADMFVQDYENFGANETTRRQMTNTAILSQGGIAQAVMNFEVRMGGEVRVEFHLRGQLLDDDGNAYIDGEAKLFEGTSESTGDLDGVRQVQLYVPAGATVNHFVRVNNEDENDDDYATIAVTITNGPA